MAFPRKRAIADRRESEVNAMPDTTDHTIHTLVPSTSRGRYALDDPLHGQDLTSGQPLALLLGGRWIDGSIEHASGLYAIEQVLQPVSSGYYFLASDGNVCGLCAGMQVRAR
jgi:Domain of unknown function (DUF5348)